MEMRQLDGCCGVVEIFDLNLYFKSPLHTPEDYKKQILKELTKFLEKELKYDTIHQLPSCFIATTNSKDQPEQEIALKELGFRTKAFCGRGVKRNDKNLKFWMKTSIPKEIMSKLKEIKAEYEKENF